jgi:hypothetical protein
MKKKSPMPFPCVGSIVAVNHPNTEHALGRVTHVIGVPTFIVDQGDGKLSYFPQEICSLANRRQRRVFNERAWVAAKMRN